MRELLIGNIIFLGEIPSQAGTWQSDEETSSIDYSVRARFFAERLLELGVDECTTDSSGNPIGIIKGSDPNRAPILVVAELDSLYTPPGDIHYALTEDSIVGPGLMDNAIGAAAILSIPDILQRLKLEFRSDIIIAGICNTMQDDRNMLLYDTFLDSLGCKPVASIIVKGGQLGRLNYFSDAVVRANVVCVRRDEEREAADNMIEVITEIVSRLLTIRTPKKPQTALNVGIIKAGYKYGDPAATAKLGLEVHSTDNAVLADIIRQVHDILDLVRYEERADISFLTMAEMGASNLGWNHELTKAAIAVLRGLALEPDVYPSVSELYYFLKRKLPAVTIGIATGYNYHQDDTSAAIPSVFKGLAQLMGLLMAIDEMEKQ
ncbi:MAG: hypothetical protein KKI09_10865 [Spirochaetes bacterium]|nr:hypothetical protein [Spirochaetota bacterium]